MIQKRNPIFNKVITKAQNHGIYDMLGYDNTINFSIDGHCYALCVKEIPTIFGLANNDYHRADIANERTMADNELTTLYLTGNESNYGTIHGLLPEFIIFNKIF
jgi:hypothetical protein